MSYRIKEIFSTVQGEGQLVGTLAAFVRFAGCNLWGGDLDKREGKGACAKWCDTDFRRGETPAHSLEEVVQLAREKSPLAQLVVLTGGEPLLQVDQLLIDALLSEFMVVAIETNGTVRPKADLSRCWVTCSPKLDPYGEPLELAIDQVNELKVVVPGWSSQKFEGWTIKKLECLVEQVSAQHHFIQPQDPALSMGYLTPKPAWYFEQCMAIVEQSPRWRLGIQMQKVYRLP